MAKAMQSGDVFLPTNFSSCDNFTEKDSNILPQSLVVVYNDSSKNNDFWVSGWIIDELSVVDLVSGQRLGIPGSPIP
jgi:hypothetical protein